MTRGIQIIDPEERFTIDLEGASLTLRRVDSAAMRAIERRHNGGADRRAVNDDVLDYALVDWAGVYSPLGQAEVPCTRENKLKLPGAVKLKVLAAAQALRAAGKGD